jgi:hypothetical protein
MHASIHRRKLNKMKFITPMVFIFFKYITLESFSQLLYNAFAPRRDMIILLRVFLGSNSLEERDYIYISGCVEFTKFPIKDQSENRR